MESPSPHRSSCSTGYATPDPQRTSSNEAQLFVGTRALTPLSSQPSHTTALVSLPSLQRRSCLHAASSASLVSLNERKLVALSASAQVVARRIDSRYKSRLDAHLATVHAPARSLNHCLQVPLLPAPVQLHRV